MLYNVMRLGLAVYLFTMFFGVIASFSVFQSMWAQAKANHDAAQAMVAQAEHRLLIYDTADNAAVNFDAIEPAAGY